MSCRQRGFRWSPGIRQQLAKGQCLGPGEDPPPQTWRSIYSRWDLGGGCPRPAEAFRVVRKGNVDDGCLRMKEGHLLRTLSSRLGAGLWRTRGLSASLRTQEAKGPHLVWDPRAVGARSGPGLEKGEEKPGKQSREKVRIQREGTEKKNFL